MTNWLVMSHLYSIVSVRFYNEYYVTRGDFERFLHIFFEKNFINGK